MVELKDVKKTYKSKKSTSTEALKGVSIKFGDNGLCFILGKSGSGKSTLLNILGGLDNYTSGDIIINNRSTKDFKDGEWDAYRNTYMGFIFQEFNLLDNYTVEENIKLSLELQNKKCTQEEILQSLKMVELDDVLKRKPNELSGGQKQRVSIARALIKNPKIILADEPTGNLDSETSKQVFDILKKLSKEKLVIVVSHDEEAAKKYADRIIKIVDGYVVADNNEYIVETNKELKLVKAKLPFIYSFKMGLGNLLYKKFKLLLSVLLIVSCLVCFGLMISILSINVNDDYIKIFEKKGPVEVFVTKYNKKVVYEDIIVDEIKNMFNTKALDDIFPTPATIDEGFVREVSNKTNMNWYAEYSVTNNFDLLSWNYASTQGSNEMIYYYIGDALIAKNMNFIEFNTELFDINKLIGKKPESDDEIVISSYIAKQIMHYGILAKKEKQQDKTEIYKPNNYDELINDGYYINLGNMSYVKVVGIINYDDYLSKYAKLKDTKASTLFDMPYGTEKDELDKLYSELVNDCTYLTRIYVNKSFIDNLDLKEENKSNSNSKVLINDKIYDIVMFGYIANNIDIINNNGKENKVNLKNNEVIINTYTLNLITNGDYEIKLQESVENNTFSDNISFLKTYIINNQIINKKIKSSICDNKNYNDSDNFCEYEISGIIDDNLEYSMIYYNKDRISSLISKNLKINSIFRKVNNVDELKTILKYYPINQSNTISSSAYSDALLVSMSVSYLFKMIGKYGTILFLIFAVILLINFISNSIKFRKKEIGILRALGCRSIDVIMMFIYEILVLMFACLIIASGIIPKIVNIANDFISSTLGVSINIMNFGLVQLCGVTAIMLIIVVVTSIIPIRKLTKTKPVDIILDK